MLTRFLLIFALGIACVLLWGFLLGAGRKKLSDTDPTDEDLGRAKTAQYYVCDKARQTGGVG